ncbi:MAG: hypothetical protein IJ560_03150 [Alphaproteobacteria bacterium]|nr:hypothetical protein [Alphaproteobacteria bacterium]
MENQFIDKKFDATRAEKFGFIKSGCIWQYECGILGGKFILRICVDSHGVRDGLYDTATGDEYILHRIDAANGAFVGRVRTAYDDAISYIVHECFTMDVFRAKQTHQVIEYAARKYGNAPEYLWQKFPRNAVLRCADNKKWYAAILSLPQNRLYGKSDDIIEIIDIRTANVGEMVDNKNIFPGWHMNKQNWITIVLDGRMPIRRIYQLLDISFNIARGK